MKQENPAADPRNTLMTHISYLLTYNRNFRVITSLNPADNLQHSMLETYCSCQECTAKKENLRIWHYINGSLSPQDPIIHPNQEDEFFQADILFTAPEDAKDISVQIFPKTKYDA